MMSLRPLINKAPTATRSAVLSGGNGATAGYY